jgi:hypothetical protein
MMTDHRMRFVAVGCPVVAGPIIGLVGHSPRKSPAMGIRSGKYVVLLRQAFFPAESIHQIARLGHRRPHIDEIGVTLNIAVEIGEICCNHDTIGIKPGPLADAIACVYRRLALGSLGAQIGAPSAVAGPNGRCQALAFGIRARKAAQIAVMHCTGYKKAQRLRLLLTLCAECGSRSERRTSRGSQ